MDAGGAHQVRVGAIARQQKHGIGRQLFVVLSAPAVRTTTDVGRISVTHVLKRAAIDPSLIRFSMSGLTQYLIVDFSSARRCTSVTCAPARKHLERRLGRGVPAADDDDALAEVGVRLRVVVMHVRQILAGHADQIRMVVVADREHDVRACRTRRTPRDGPRLDGEHARPRAATDSTVSSNAICRSYVSTTFR